MSEPVVRPTICAECQHFVCDGPIWYSQFCGASPLPVRIDPVTGKEMPHGVNSLGQSYPSENKFRFARDVNHGNCDQFKERYN